MNVNYTFVSNTNNICSYNSKYSRIGDVFIWKKNEYKLIRSQQCRRVTKLLNRLSPVWRWRDAE